MGPTSARSSCRSAFRWASRWRCCSPASTSPPRTPNGGACSTASWTPTDVLPTAMRLAERIAANAPISVRRMKETAVKGLELPLWQALRLDVGPNPYLSEDRKEGIAAYLEKRPPRLDRLLTDARPQGRGSRRDRQPRIRPNSEMRPTASLRWVNASSAAPRSGGGCPRRSSRRARRRPRRPSSRRSRRGRGGAAAPSPGGRPPATARRVRWRGRARGEELVGGGHLVDHPEGQRLLRPTVSARSTARSAFVPSACRTISSAVVGNGTPTASSARPIRPPDISRTSQASASTQPPAIASVDRGDRRPRMVEHRAEHPRQRHEERLGVGPSAVQDPAQIHAGGERRTGAGEDQRPVGVADGVGDRVQQLGVHGAHPAVLDAHDGDVVLILDVQHRAIMAHRVPGTTASASASAGCCTRRSGAPSTAGNIARTS